MIISKESTVLRAGSKNSKQITIPYLIGEVLNIEVGDTLRWCIDGAEDHPKIEMELIKKE